MERLLLDVAHACIPHRQVVETVVAFLLQRSSDEGLNSESEFGFLVDANGSPKQELFELLLGANPPLHAHAVLENVASRCRWRINSDVFATIQSINKRRFEESEDETELLVANGLVRASHGSLASLP